MSRDRALELLSQGAISIKGRMPWSSNVTLLAELALAEVTALAVYKPERGERPLWDFPPGLYKREIAAYCLSEALGWGIVPPTVLREGPHGEGSLQLFVQADFEQHYLTLLERPEHREQLQQICVFDLVTNNADRKSGHCLLGPDGRIYAIDNGLTFHVEPKLRTVIWDFGGEPIPRALLDAIMRLVQGRLPAELAELLAEDEQKALLARGRALVKRARFPKDASGLRYPWPLV
ncbi:MAG: phosphatidylinositol kinase [Candidatus Rokuibacteriota bacterium]|nr:MAG: phosphatidylinositol kinase [Candidatus Rokubacteria bacterium]